MEIKINSKKYGEKIVLIDDEDFGKISNYKWYLNHDRRNNYYAQTHIYKNGKRSTISMHKIVLDCFDSKIIDHINLNTLDNRKCNLRYVSVSENGMNRKVNRGNKSSKYKGVSFQKRYNTYRSQIMLNGVLINVGSFKTEKEAAEAYNRKAIELFEEFANINIIEDSL